MGAEVLPAIWGGSFVPIPVPLLELVPQGSLCDSSVPHTARRVLEASPH